jgi:hypothetical protein
MVMGCHWGIWTLKIVKAGLCLDLGWELLAADPLGWHRTALQ